MNTKIDSLKALYVKLGGSLTDTYSDIAPGVPVADYSVISDMIFAVKEVASSGSGDLSNYYTKEETDLEIQSQISDCKKQAVVTCNTQEKNSFTADKTLEEIKELINDGYEVICKITQNGYGYNHVSFPIELKVHEIYESRVTFFGVLDGVQERTSFANKLSISNYGGGVDDDIYFEWWGESTTKVAAFATVENDNTLSFGDDFDPNELINVGYTYAYPYNAMLKAIKPGASNIEYYLPFVSMFDNTVNNTLNFCFSKEIVTMQSDESSIGVSTIVSRAIAIISMDKTTHEVVETSFTIA